MARSEKEILAEYRRTKDPQLIGELVLKCVGPVHALVRSMVIDVADINDLVQEVFLRAVRGLSDFNGTSKVSTWMHEIALNTTLSYLTERKRQITSSGLGNSAASEMDANPLEQVISAETRTRIQAAMSELTPKLRAAIVLTAELGYSPAEAAKLAGCNPATMYWRVHQARSILRARLQSVLDEGDWS